ncbi:MAG: diaminopimelate epimerase [Rhodomicrobium sp.]|nr:diaminopimelate epimerase [Rhodomicrobium sp.]
MELRHIPFKKMNGLGNDFVMIDARAEPIRLSAAAAGAIARRNGGAGCDQVIVLEPSRAADVFMRILNADGSEVSACGNATRCVAELLQPELGRSRVTIETRAGLLLADVAASGLVTADMGVPRFKWVEIPLSRPFEDTRAIDLTYALPDGRVLAGPSIVNVGNPHCIFWVNDADSYDLASFGSALEHDPLFPERANISLAEVKGEDALKLRVWERGAGITRACGTAACAAAVAAARTGRTGRLVTVELPGGALSIEWRAADGHMLMTGPTELEFDGVLSFNGDGRLIEVARHS